MVRKLKRVSEWERNLGTCLACSIFQDVPAIVSNSQTWKRRLRELPQ